MRGLLINTGIVVGALICFIAFVALVAMVAMSPGRRKPPKLATEHRFSLTRRLRRGKSQAMPLDFNPVEVIKANARALYNNATLGPEMADEYETLLAALDTLDSWDGLMWLLDHHQADERTYIPEDKAKRLLEIKQSELNQAKN